MNCKKIYLLALIFVLLIAFSGCNSETSTISGEISKIQSDAEGNVEIISVRKFDEDENHFITVAFPVNNATKVYMGKKGTTEMSLEDLSLGINVSVTYQHIEADMLTYEASIIRILD